MAGGRHHTSATDSVDELTRLAREYPDLLLVAVDDGRIVGSLLAGWDGWRAGIYRLAVTPEYRRRGVGRALAKEAEVRLHARGARVGEPRASVGRQACPP
jgi:ribosomal protein S18 acetylase RimI-like enzyme